MVALTIAVLAVYTIASLGGLHLLLNHLADRDQRQQQERDAHRNEVAQLLQRIQAPTEAVYQHATTSTGPAQTFPPSDGDLVEIQDAELAAALAKVTDIQEETGVL